MRLLAGILAGQPFRSVLTGNESLRSRPMGRISEPLSLMGARIEGRDGGNLPPLTICRVDLRGIDYTMPVASAQVKSAILLGGLYAEGETIVRESRRSRDHTERMLEARGVEMRREGDAIFLTPPDELGSKDVEVPGDLSSAAFFIAAAAIVPGSEVQIRNVGVNPTRTGLLALLTGMGADISLEGKRCVGGEPIADLVIRHRPLQGGMADGDLIPLLIDEVPLIAVIATQAQGITEVRDAAELRVKESDRISAIVAELRKMGARIEERLDGFTVEGPTPLESAGVQSHEDHRIAMAMAIAGLVAGGETRVDSAGCISDSFPGFEEELAKLVRE
jgi:3-phosphoshikimate 1-carboxyvinyltransferase